MTGVAVKGVEVAGDGVEMEDLPTGRLGIAILGVPLAEAGKAESGDCDCAGDDDGLSLLGREYSGEADSFGASFCALDRDGS